MQLDLFDEIPPEIREIQRLNKPDRPSKRKPRYAGLLEAIRKSEGRDDCGVG